MAGGGGAGRFCPTLVVLDWIRKLSVGLNATFRVFSSVVARQQGRSGGLDDGVGKGKEGRWSSMAGVLML